MLPEVAVEAPEKINFNMCAAHDMVQLTFEIRNARSVKLLEVILISHDFNILNNALSCLFKFILTIFPLRLFECSELVTPFLVECKEPFFIEPTEGVLEPFTTFTLTATFKPKVN